MAESTHILEPGIYQMINANSGTAIDLAGYDGRSLIGYTSHKGPNQQWAFTPLGLGYSLRSVQSGSYLTAEQGIHTDADLTANGYPVSWAIDLKDRDAGLYEIFWPNSSLVLELSRKEGDGSGGKIRLGRREGGAGTQLWCLVPCRIDATPTRSSNQHQLNSSAITNGPAQATATTTADTVIDTDGFKDEMDGSGEMVITTTTTTVTTTVTKVQRVKTSEVEKILEGGGEGGFEVV